MTRDAFEKLVGEAFDALPKDVLAKLDNVAVCVENNSKGGDLLGLYHGIAQPERDSGYTGVLPDKIILYQRTIEEESGSDDPDAIREEIRRTLWHEIAHHFGWDDEALHQAERQKGWRNPSTGRIAPPGVNKAKKK